jgi:aerobic carbon-monoxide dehydrogenase small subunit
MKQRLAFKVNGNPVELFIEPNTLLVEVLRDKLSLTGTKRGCSDSSCGACTIIIDGCSAKSCSILAMQAQDSEIITVEGLAQDTKLTEIQRAFLDHGAYQCGFCTPGMLMSSTALFLENPHPNKEEIKEGIEGNICRCTGYNSIVRALTDVSAGKYKEAK